MTLIRVSDTMTIANIDAHLATLHRGRDDHAIDILLARRHELTHASPRAH